MFATFELSDGTFRAYKKKNGDISLHLKTFLYVHTVLSFGLSAYLKDIKGWLEIKGKPSIEIDSIVYTDTVVLKNDDMMVHELWLETRVINDLKLPCSADLTMKFHLSFSGHPDEEPEYITKKCFIVSRF